MMDVLRPYLATMLVGDDTVTCDSDCILVFAIVVELISPRPGPAVSLSELPVSLWFGRRQHRLRRPEMPPNPSWEAEIVSAIAGAETLLRLEERISVRCTVRRYFAIDSSDFQEGYLSSAQFPTARSVRCPGGGPIAPSPLAGIWLYLASLASN
jgi:hypothetical protein